MACHPVHENHLHQMLDRIEHRKSVPCAMFSPMRLHISIRKRKLKLDWIESMKINEKNFTSKIAPLQ